MSSEWSRFRILHVPLPSAARIRARFEILLLPGVAMVTGDFAGIPGTTLADSHRTLRSTSSSTLDAFSSYVLPILERRTTFFCEPEFFLSTFIMSNNRSTVSPLEAGIEEILRSERDTGRLYACKHRVRRPTATWESTPSDRATSASRIMPTATHSPCSMVGVSTASIACPMVCPKLTKFRSPVSRSSIVTMCALT